MRVSSASSQLWKTNENSDFTLLLVRVNNVVENEENCCLEKVCGREQSNKVGERCMKFLGENVDGFHLY
jgi:hypothetical protein